MAVEFQIQSDHNLVFVSFRGHVTVSETMAAFDKYANHPDFRPGQTQLVDLSQVKSYERDFTKIMALQAHQTEAFLGSENRPYLMFIAPNKLTRGMAMAAVRSWQHLNAVVPLVVSSIAEAAEVLSFETASLGGFREPVQ